jgi:phosphoglycolate phosphatase-like HAD superfamily hydrolase
VTRRLILWDVDGTLLRTGGAGRHALEFAAATAAGLETVPEVRMSGKTDPRIIREILTAAGVTDNEIDRLMPDATAAAES